MGDMGVCQVGPPKRPPKAPELARPRSSAAWLHTSACLYLLTTACRIRQYLPKIATSWKEGAVGTPSPRGWSDGDCVSPRGDPSGWVPDEKLRRAFRGRARAAACIPLCLSPVCSPRQRQQHNHWSFPLVYKSISFKHIVCFHTVSSYAGPKCSGCLI